MLKDTFDWYKGEIFEAKCILGFGIFIVVCSLLFYFFGNTPKSKSLLIPMLAISLFFITTGITMINSNINKIKETAQNQTATDLVDNEIKRVEDFQYLYPLSIGISLVCFVVAISFLYFVKNIHFQSIAIALILFGSAFAIIDYFSKERAAIYYEKLINLKSEIENA